MIDSSISLYKPKNKYSHVFFSDKNVQSQCLVVTCHAVIQLFPHKTYRCVVTSISTKHVIFKLEFYFVGNMGECRGETSSQEALLAGWHLELSWDSSDKIWAKINWIGTLQQTSSLLLTSSVNLYFPLPLTIWVTEAEMKYFSTKVYKIPSYLTRLSKARCPVSLWKGIILTVSAN